MVNNNSGDGNSTTDDKTEDVTRSAKRNCVDMSPDPLVVSDDHKKSPNSKHPVAPSTGVNYVHTVRTEPPTPPDTAQ